MSKSNDRGKLGRQGEKLARKYLKKQGYRHLSSNFSTGRGEIDLIMQEGETVVFVEVKTRRDESFACGEEIVNYHKQRHMAGAARHFIHAHNLYESPCRFDTVVVVMGRGKPVIRHQRNAFGLAGKI